MKGSMAIQSGWSGPVVSVEGASPSPPPRGDLHVHLLSGEDAERPLLAAAAAVAAASAAVTEKSGGGGDDSDKDDDGGGDDERRQKSNSAASSSTASASKSGRDALDAALDAAAAAAAAAVASPSKSPFSSWSSKPDVALCYGDHLTLAGFPPWGLAQSEIYAMGPLREARREGVEEAAARFLSTSQRFGR